MIANGELFAARYIDSNLSFHFNFTIYTNTYLTPPFVRLLIYILFNIRICMLSLQKHVSLTQLV